MIPLSSDIFLPSFLFLFWNAYKVNVCSALEAKILVHSYVIIVLGYWNISCAESDEALFLLEWKLLRFQEYVIMGYFIY